MIEELYEYLTRHGMSPELADLCHDRYYDEDNAGIARLASETTEWGSKLEAVLNAWQKETREKA